MTGAHLTGAHLPDGAAPVVIVTGAGSGIGYATARHLAAQGRRTVLASLQGAEEMVNRLAELHGEVLYVQTDVRDEGSVQALIDRTVAHFGRLDGLVNNAGVTVEHDFLSATVADFEHLISTNLRSVFLCSQRAARVMRDQGGGVIVNVASNHAGRSLPNFDLYAATKGGVVSLTRAMAWSLGRYGIRAVSVSPGLTLVESLQDWLARDPSAAQYRQHYRDVHATGRSNAPADVAEVIAFVLSDAARGMTGEDVVVDNGMSALLFNNLKFSGGTAVPSTPEGGPT